MATVAPEKCSTVVTEEGYELIEMAVGSGATETVIPENTSAHIELREGEAYNNGIRYEVANGVRIGNQAATGVTEEGVTRSLIAQVLVWPAHSC